MFKKLKLKRRLLILSIPVLIIVSALAVYSNNIFYFSEFKSVVEIKYTSEDSEKLKTVFDNSLNFTNIAKINRETNTLEVQNESLESVKTKVNEVLKDTQNVSSFVTEISSVARGNLSSLIAGLYVLFLAGIAIHFYFISAKGGELRIILGSYVVWFVNLTIGTILSIGLLSLISRFYKIESLDLLLILIASILSFLIYYISAEDIYEIKNFQSLGNHFREFSVKNTRKIFAVIVILLGITTIGLGTAFVIHALILFALIVIAFYQYYWHAYLMEDWHNIRAHFEERFSSARSLRYKKKAAPQQVNAVVTSKKKDKKKKKKK